MAFAFKEAQEFLANFRACRHQLYCIEYFAADWEIKGRTAKVAKDAKDG
jgi:hypothetical protein